MAELTFDRDFDPQHGRLVTVVPGISRLVAPNTGPYTFTGTNTYLIGESRIVVVDPGPRIEAHAEALTEAIGDRKVTAIVLTHSHDDHAGLARIVQNRVDCPCLSAGAYAPMRPLARFEFDPMRFSHLGGDPDFILQADDRIDSDGPALIVVPTPGHTCNHIALAVEGTDYLLTGDHVMGWSSTLVADPDGAMEPYLASLDALQAVTQDRYLPGHGGEIGNGKSYAAALKAHRLARDEQIIAAISAGAHSVRGIVEIVYGPIAQKTRWAAQLTVRAHLFRLAELGGVRRAAKGWMGIAERWELSRNP